MAENQDIRVMVVDDSAFMRQAISRMIAEEPGLTVVERARDGLDALRKLESVEVDVITLDVEMPRLDGLGFLQRLMKENPKPVVMLSSLTQEGAEVTLQALSLGAVDFVPKPSGAISLDIAAVKKELVNKVRHAARARVSPALRLLPKATPTRTAPGKPAGWLMVIGASTGGPNALQEVFSALPLLPAAILVVQHMPPGFTRSLAARLDYISAWKVREAAEGDALIEGEALVAPGGRHLLVDEDRTVRLDDGPPVHSVKPAVDPTLESAVKVFGSRVTAAILTGMGFDGAKGLGMVRQAGGRTLAQDRESSVVFGMPRAAIEIGGAEKVVPLKGMARALSESLTAGGNQSNDG